MYIIFTPSSLFIIYPGFFLLGKKTRGSGQGDSAHVGAVPRPSMDREGERILAWSLRATPSTNPFLAPLSTFFFYFIIFFLSCFSFLVIPSHDCFPEIACFLNLTVQHEIRVLWIWSLAVFFRTSRPSDTLMKLKKWLKRIRK